MFYQLNKEFTKTGIAAVLIATIIFFSNSCYYDKAELLYPGSGQVDCNTIPAKFAANVQPLIATKCATAGCHNATAAGGIILQNYTGINSAKERVNIRAVGEKSMPPSGPLLPAETNIIKCWIEGGALNN